MRGFAFAAFAAGLLAVTAVGQTAPGPAAGPGEPAENGSHSKIVSGVAPQEIADSSPGISATLSTPQDKFKAGSVIKIHVVLENRTDHGIRYSGSKFYSLIVLDVRDKNGGLAPETELGCREHFFSPCHPAMRTFPNRARPIAPHGTLEGDELLSEQYNLALGTYTVVGYVCGMSEGPQCFKTNQITIAVE